MPAASREPIDTRGDYVIKRNTIPDYYTQEFVKAYRVWARWNKHGVLPFSGGWMEQPAHVIDVLNMFDPIYGEWQDEPKAGG
jgi:hypothetical protein